MASRYLIATTSTSSADSGEFDPQSGTTIGNRQQWRVHITLKTLQKNSFDEDRKKLNNNYVNGLAATLGTWSLLFLSILRAFTALGVALMTVRPVILQIAAQLYSDYLSLLQLIHTFRGG